MTSPSNRPAFNRQDTGSGGEVSPLDEVYAEDVDRSEAYKLLVGSIVPRAIAWVSTVSSSGVHNLAPFSFYTVASPEPPTLVFSVGPSLREGSQMKDTLDNIIATGQMTINTASVANLEALVATSAPVASGLDEFDLAGLTPEPSALVAAQRVAEAPISMECVLEQTLEVGSNTLVLAHVLLWRFASGLRIDGKVDMKRLDPLGRLGGPQFATDMTIIERRAPRDP